MMRVIWGKKYHRAEVPHQLVRRGLYPIQEDLFAQPGSTVAIGILDQANFQAVLPFAALVGSHKPGDCQGFPRGHKIHQLPVTLRVKGSESCQEVNGFQQGCFALRV